MHVIYEGLGLGRPNLAWRERWILLRGKVRRVYLLAFRPGYVEASLKRRVGSCNRTGACCHLTWSCPLLGRSAGTPSCRVYLNRPKSCSSFPLDERDLRDRDLINPTEPCGFSFAPAEARAKDTTL